MVDSIADNARAFGMPRMRMFYNGDVRELIVKMPKRPLEMATRCFCDLITLQTHRMGLDDQLVPTGSATISGSPYKKEPYASYVAMELPPGRNDKWPTLVIETGFLGSLRRLRVDAEWWLVRSRGDVKVAIIIAVD